MKKLYSIACIALPCIAVQAQSPSLKIYSGAPDTLRTEKTVLVAVTDPGATATVNGLPVHVYKTGSFGTELTLQPCDNSITVSVSNGNGRTDRTLNIFRAEKNSASAKSTQADERTTFFDTPEFVKSLPGAYLQYGNGDDRLGGSKMGFIDAGIPLKVIGKKGSLLCVRLAADRLAYIPAQYTEPSATPTRVVNTGSWSVTNTGKTDRVVVALPTRLPYQYFTESDPSAICIDLFGATDNSNWITQRTLDLGIIDYVDFRQVSDDVYRVIIRLKEKYQWGFSVGYGKEGTNLSIDVRHAPKSLALKDLTIGLDAGHGGPYPGAISPSGLKEKEMNLDIVHRIDKLLQAKGAKTVLTRDGDTGPSMTERKQIWADGNVDIAISVHNNSGGGALASPGTAVLYKHQFDRAFSECVARRLVGTGLPLFGLVGNFNFSLNGPTLYPNCLVEGMFMSSLKEEEMLADPDFRQRVAAAIVNGLEDYLSTVKRSR